jgi:DNA-directed RNA polymerase omega subunit
MTLREMEKYLNSMDSRYRAVVVAAKRAKQLQKALRPLFEGKSVKVTTLALDELVSNRVVYYKTEEAAQLAQAQPEAESAKTPETPPAASEKPAETVSKPETETKE